MENRTQFTFYESFYKALSRIKNKAVRADAFDCICKYALYSEMPDMETLPDSVSMAFELIRPTLDSSRKKSENGKKGGSKSKQTESKRKQTGSKPKANVSKAEANLSKQEANASESKKEKEVENKREKEIEKENKNECYYYPLISPFLENADSCLRETLLDWMQYKTERKDTYTETGLKSLLTQISGAVEKHGAETVADHIRLAMSNGWVGMNLNLIEEKQARAGTQRKPGNAVQRHGDALDDLEKAAIAAVMEGDDEDIFAESP